MSFDLIDNYRNGHLSEADTRAKLIDPALYQRRWTEQHFRREETAGTIEIVDGKPRRHAFSGEL